MVDKALTQLHEAHCLYWDQTKNAGWTKAGHAAPTYSFYTALTSDDIKRINDANDFASLSLKACASEVNEFENQIKKQAFEEVVAKLNNLAEKYEPGSSILKGIELAKKIILEVGHG